VTDQWSSPSNLVSSTKKTDDHDITEILLRVALNSINLNLSILSDKGMGFKLTTLSGDNHVIMITTTPLNIEHRPSSKNIYNIYDLEQNLITSALYKAEQIQSVAASCKVEGHSGNTLKKQ